MPFTPKYCLVFRWCLYNKQNITWLLGDIKISLLVYFTLCCAHSGNIFSTQEEKFHISAQPCSIFYVLFCHLVWKHLEILTCFKLMSPERVEKNQWGFHIWDWCQQPLFFFTVQELCSEHVTLFTCLLVFYVQY